MEDGNGAYHNNDYHHYRHYTCNNHNTCRRCNASQIKDCEKLEVEEFFFLFFGLVCY